MKKLIKNLIWPVVFLGVCTAVIYYRAFLFPADFNKPVDIVLDDASGAIDYNVPSYQLSPGEVPVYNKIFGEEAIQVDTKSEPIQPLEKEITSMEAGDSEKDNTSGESDLNLDDIVIAVKETVNQALNTFKSENGEIIHDNNNSAATTLTANELLFKARLAYWNRDLKTAESTYIKLIEIADDPNAFGELGNLYYMQSKWKKASTAYYNAAIKLKNINQIDQALHLLRIIRGLDTDTANKLQSELQQTS